LISWNGRLIKIEEAPKVLNKKYYDRFRHKEVKKYEWTILKKYILAEVQRLDKVFKKSWHKMLINSKLEKLLTRSIQIV